MAPSFTLQILENCQISPAATASSSVNNGSWNPAPTNLPLTFLDIPWLLFPPSQPLYFFQLAQSTHAESDFFNTTVLPCLKQSLSSALRFFTPFAGKLSRRPQNDRDYDLLLSCSDISQNCFGSGSESGFSSVRVIVAQCDADFDELCSHRSRNAVDFHKLVPQIPIPDPFRSSESDSDPFSFPLLTIQITRFRAGFSIGFTCHHVICDQRTFHHFVRSWASISKLGHLPDGLEPSFDRSVIVDPMRVRPILLNQYRLWQESKFSLPTSDKLVGMVRATFVMGPTDIRNTKRWALVQCDQSNRAYPVLLSPYVLTCSFVWACLVKAQQNIVSKGSMYFGFIAGGLTRLPNPVPVNYFGNCVAFGRAVAKRGELLKEDGVLVAIDVIGQTIKDLDNDVLGGAEHWILDWEAIIGSDLHINVVGSPKVGLYDSDFGWGIPKKIEEISIDVMRGISLMDSRNMKGGIEVGLTLPKSTMDMFSIHFSQGLLVMDSCF